MFHFVKFELNFPFCRVFVIFGVMETDLALSSKVRTLLIMSVISLLMGILQILNRVLILVLILVVVLFAFVTVFDVNSC